VTPESDRRSILVELIRASAQSFERSDIDLRRLVSDLESTIDALTDVADADWVEELRSMWWRLELINALAMDESRTNLSDEERGEIGAILDELRAALVAY
jgi:hypothetical protein